jgi:hypothetical protein
MEQEAFRKFVEIIKSKVIQEFNQNGEFPPTWFLDTGDNRVLELITAFENDFEKEVYDTVMRHAIKEHKVQRYVYVSEVWYVTARTEQECKGPAPRNRSDRREALMLSAEDISGARATGFSDIHRRSDTNLAMIDDIRMEENLQVTSGPNRFVNMFKDKDESYGTTN